MRLQTVRELEAALTMTERERDEAREELAAAKLRVSDLKHALGIDAQGWFDRFKQAQKECEIFKSRLDHAEADFDQAMHYETARALDAERERDEALAKYDVSVTRAANEKLDGFRKFTSQLAEMVAKRDKARAECVHLRLQIARLRGKGA